MDLFVLLVGDRVAVATARALALRAPLARKHFDHYRGGCGSPRVVDTATLLQEDDGVRAVCCEHIRRSVQNGVDAGEVPVPQWRFRNRDWRYALGSVQMQWRQEGSDIVMWFRDRYCWHPAVRRITQALHRAADHLRQDDAQEYEIEGLPHRLSLATVRSSRRPRSVPAYQRLYL